MKLKQIILGSSAITLAAAFATGNAQAADGEALYKAKGCVACHGATAMGGVGPRLASIQANYLSEQFILIRDGKRTSGKSAIMAGAVKNVTDDEAKAIAGYLSALK